MHELDNATPLIKQYMQIKAEYPDTLLLFQVGDFYELLFDDARTAAACLNIVLTARGKHRNEPIPLCGVPLHAIDTYLAKLIKAGHKVALCDQLEPPKPGAVVARGVTQVITPGTVTDIKLLDAKAASYILSCVQLDGMCGLLFGELMTAQLFATVVAADQVKGIEAEVIRFFPDEIILPHTALGMQQQRYFTQMGYYTTMVDEAHTQGVAQWVACQFRQEQQEQLRTVPSIEQAVAYFYGYIRKTQQHVLDQFTTIAWYTPEDFLMLDSATQRNLELVKNSSDNSTTHTLFSVLDRCATSMGSRMIKKWIMRPLAKQIAIEQRYDAIEKLLHNERHMHEAQRILHAIGDLERVVGRIGLHRATAGEYLTLVHMLTACQQLRTLCEIFPNLMVWSQIHELLIQLESVSMLLSRALHEDAAAGIIAQGFDEELDQMRVIIKNAQENIVRLEVQEQQKTGITSLKIRYNSVQGYYIELTKTYVDSVPAYYTRLQTLVGRERFMTPELQKMQYELIQAQENIDAYEQKLFEKLKNAVAPYTPLLRRLAYTAAYLDALISFALCARERRYVRPTLNNQGRIKITAGRHPVVEQVIDTAFVPNDGMLDEDERLWIITGPNMGGKSTYLRQTALQVIMAHCGSYVPAQHAEIPLMDRIFTRIGAGDNLAQGKSTFLVEMEETATICHHATEKSLVILDEVGRGTSTYDGLALAQAVVEYIYESVKARCLFATHYHELTALAQLHQGIKAYHVASKKTSNGIIFLYRMQEGAADRSFGIDIAQLAELPAGILQRARMLLPTLQDKTKNNQGRCTQIDSVKQPFFESEEYWLYTYLEQLDIDTLSPRDALQELYHLKEKARMHRERE